VTLLTQAPAGPAAEPVGRYIIGLLRRLGYRADLRVVNPNRWDAAINDYRHPPQIDTNSWIADYPSPSQWITLQLGCAAWHPPTVLTNHSQFCDPTVDRLAAQAARLQTTNPATADQLWVRLIQIRLGCARAIESVGYATILSAPYPRPLLSRALDGGRPAGLRLSRSVRTPRATSRGVRSGHE
jgi:hypothetical protein